MNQCHFMGEFTQEPRLEDRDGGTKSLIFTLAITRKFKKADGSLGSQTSYLNFEAWDSGAEAIARTFKRGDLIIVHCSARNYSDHEVVFRVKEFQRVDS